MCSNIDAKKFEHPSLLLSLVRKACHVMVLFPIRVDRISNSFKIASHSRDGGHIGHKGKLANILCQQYFLPTNIFGGRITVS